MRLLTLIFSAAVVSFSLFAEEDKPTQDSKTTQVIPIDSQKAGSLKGIITISPQARSQDFVKAFDLLKRDKPSSRIFYRLANGQTLTNIVEVSALESGTLLLFKISTTQGLKYVVIAIEDVLEIGHS